MSKKRKNDEERRNHRKSIAELLMEAVINLSGVPANKATKWIPIMIIVIVCVQPVSDTLVAFAQPLSDAIVALSGKTTVVDVKANAGNGAPEERKNDATTQEKCKAAAQKECKNGFQFYSLLLAVGGILFGMSMWVICRRERRMRYDVIHQKSDRIQYLEGIIDANRTSSGLTQRGETHPEDK